MSTIQNLQSFDPFADATKGDDLLPAGTEDYIHIRIQQRNGRKTLTTVQGIADDYDKKKLVKAFKKKFACNGTVIEHPEYGEVIQLQGDQRKNICQFLLEVGIVKEEQLKGKKGVQFQEKGSEQKECPAGTYSVRALESPGYQAPLPFADLSLVA
ncbi:Eukaryotic translation initiation factor 1b [Saguinus oedipus]|uniref:Eukaryotic translation initiation factor 1b n=1 Tax=Saguinus oedipus TaxID=9490 RepID=A0ABQ9TZ53_SAGOE|nr:Eukaryotic translation initiation factor 1b [Saguinus oedipus]